MKDLTEYFNTKNNYELVYGEQYSKSLKRDIKRTKLSKKLVLLVPVIGLTLYWGILLLTNSDIYVGHFWMAFGMVGMQIPGMISLKHDIEKFKKSANINLSELLRLLFRNEEDISLDCLEKSVIIEQKNKEKVEYREIETNKRIINHEIKTEETRVYFKDLEEQLKCLREIKQVVEFQGIKEESHTLELLEPRDILEEGIPAKVKKKLM